MGRPYPTQNETHLLLFNTKEFMFDDVDKPEYRPGDTLALQHKSNPKVSRSGGRLASDMDVLARRRCIIADDDGGR